MAHLKHANAVVVHPRVSGRRWDGVRRVASSGASDRNLSDQAREILGGSLDPDKYLFTHCSIVASVDTDIVKNATLGKVRVGSSTIDRRYADYFIKPQCSQFVNNNGDSWSRDVLLASYPTFVGAHNFQEHVQIEAQSKGKIIDAVARDIGDSVYIDILVATNRKHAALIGEIEAGNLTTLSMGCTTDFTICSQCGHYAVDTTDLCEHIRYSKLNTFMDPAGQKRVVAELCGHIDYTENADAPGGVRFIEASWVKVPAFPGAVMRNILSAGETNVPESEIRRLLSSSPTAWSDNAVKKAASLSVPTVGRKLYSFNFGDEEEEEKTEEAPRKPFQDLEDEVYQHVTDRVKKRLKEELRKKETEKAEEPPPADANNNVVKEGTLTPARQKTVVTARDPKVYRSTLNTLVKAASSKRKLVAGVAEVNQAYGLKTSAEIYTVALRAGSHSKYASSRHYLQAVRKLAGRDLTPAELRVVVRVGTLLSDWESNNNPQNVKSRSSK